MVHVDKIRGLICQKILPLTYDESLSYMELLCKVLDTVNQIIEVIDDFTPESLDEIKARLDAVEAKNGEQDQDIEILKQSVRNVNSLLIVLNERVGAVEANVSDLSGRLGILENTVNNNHEPRIRNLENKMRMYVEPVSVYDSIRNFVEATVEASFGSAFNFNVMFALLFASFTGVFIIFTVIVTFVVFDLFVQT